jgi:hypothetical protein
VRCICPRAVGELATSHADVNLVKTICMLHDNPGPFTTQHPIVAPCRTKQVTLTVANIADGLFQSALILDYITTGRICIRPLNLPVNTDFVHCYIDMVTESWGYTPDGVNHPETNIDPQHRTCREIQNSNLDNIKAAVAAAQPNFQACPSSIGTVFGTMCDPPGYNLASVSGWHPWHGDHTIPFGGRR